MINYFKIDGRYLATHVSLDEIKQIYPQVKQLSPQEYIKEVLNNAELGIN